MPNFTILLPPAEGKQSGGNPFAPDMFDYRSSSTFNYFNDLNPDRRKLINAVQEAIEAGEDLEDLFGVKGKNLEEAIRSNRELYKAPLMSALDRYSPGVMYKAMDFAGLPTGAQRRLLENGVIFSGLFGLLRPDDLIPNYCLSMNAVLPGTGKVSSYWRPRLSSVLNVAVSGRVVWNFLPGIHEDAWEDDHSYRQMVVVKFIQEQEGERKPLRQDVEPLRGQLVNFIVRETVEDVERLHAWDNSEGYRYDEASSTLDEETKTMTVCMVKQG
jgi:uncharacterized protein